MRIGPFLFAMLAPVLPDRDALVAGDPVISEILAANGGSLLDEDGDGSDWIEILNPDPADRDLGGWYLTDDPSILAKWRFPRTIVPAGGRIVVFASGKDRAAEGADLHTSFRLDADGEHVALVRPDGASVADELAGYPPQREDVAYGIGQEPAATLVPPGATCRFLVPRDGSPAGSWTGAEEPYDDSEGAGWTPAAMGLGYDAGGDSTRPISLWTFDDASDPESAPDASGNGNDGAITSHFELAGHGGASKPEYTPDGEGRSGLPGDRALDFGTGDGALVSVPGAAFGALDACTANDAITISLWVLGGPDQPANDSVFWGSSNTDGTGIRSLNAHIPWSDRVIYWDTAGCCDGTQRISRPDPDASHWRSQWNHYAFVKDGDAKRIWQNGSLFHEGTNRADLTPIRGFFLGGAPNNGEMSYGGLIDEVAVWAEALGADEVRSLARGASPLDLSSLRPLIATDLGDAMRDRSATVLVRIPFAADPALELDALVLRMRYDAGFVAYLNGVEVARRNAPDSLAFDSSATAARTRKAAVESQDLDVSPFRGLIRPGRNILALHGLNDRRDSPEFLLSAELLAFRSRPGRYLVPPTPGAANAAGSGGFVASPTFLPARGLHTEPFDLEIECAADGAEIWVTEDGSEPAPDAPGADRYAGPLRVAGTKVVRARAFLEDHEPSDIVTHTYVFPADVARQPAVPPGLPASWSGHPADYGVDPDVVRGTLPGYGLEDALSAVPTVSIVLSSDDLFGGSSGIYSNSMQVLERPASIELFDADGEGFQAGAGVRIHGYTSRDPSFTLKHSFRVLFKGRYGPKQLRHRLFEDTPVDRFDQFVLRGMSTDSWPVMDGWASPEPGIVRWYREKAQYLREQWMKDSQVAMGNLSTHGAFVQLYLNGLYWGLYNLTERPTDSFLSEHLGGEREEYDVLKDFAELHSGTRDAWSEMMALAAAGLSTDAAVQRIQGNRPDGARDPALPRYLDLDGLIDYMILHIHAGADDWPNHNWWAGRRRGPESEGFRFFSWDQEITNTSLIQTRTSWGPRFEEVSAPDSPAFLYAQLRANPGFRLRFADRVQRHLFDGGALAPESCIARWMTRAEEVDRAIVGESARWGDARRSVPYKREVEWLAEQRWLRETYWPQNHARALERFARVGLYPSVAAPRIEPHGGRADPGAAAAISAPAGIVWYTLDGSDPRLASGEVSPTAIRATGEAAPIGGTTTVRARARDGAIWSALAEASFWRPIPLRIAEVQYHPADPPEGSPYSDEDFEFVEIQNIGEEDVDLRGLRLTGGIELGPEEWLVPALAPGALAVAVRNLAAFDTRYDLRGLTIAGEYAGELRNSGDRLVLVGPLGEPIHDFRWDDSWHPSTDGAGPSLVIRDVLGPPESWALAESWRPSSFALGSPGVDESGGPRPKGRGRPGDINSDGLFNISDPIGLLSFLFLGDAVPLPCGGEADRGSNLALLDANGDGALDIADAIHGLGFLFLGGPPHALGTGCARLEGCRDICGH